MKRTNVITPAIVVETRTTAIVSQVLFYSRWILFCLSLIHNSGILDYLKYINWYFVVTSYIFPGWPESYILTVWWFLTLLWNHWRKWNLAYAMYAALSHYGPSKAMQAVFDCLRVWFGKYKPSVYVWLSQHIVRDDAGVVRSALANIPEPMVSRQDPNQNPHSGAAKARRVGARLIYELACAMFTQCWTYGLSNTDARRGRPGVVVFDSIKDLQVSAQATELVDGGVVRLIDRDYRRSSGQFLNWLSEGHVVAMYTFTPSCLEARRDDYSYFIEENQVDYSVDGGIHVQHPLWDWRVDTFVLSSFFRFTHVQVVRRKVDEDHHVIALVPTLRYCGWFGWLLGLCSDVPHLQQLQTTSGSTDKLCMIDSSNHTIVYLRAHGGGQVALPLAQYVEITSYPEAGGEETVGAIRRLLAGFTNDVMLTNRLVVALNGLPDRLVPLRYRVTAPVSFTPIVRGQFNEAEEVGRFFMKPILAGAVFPTRGVDSDEAAVHGRVICARSTDCQPKCSLPEDLQREIFGYICEWLRCAFPESNTLVPISAEELNDIQTKPSQRSSYRQEEPFVGIPVCRQKKQFQKNEGYEKPNWPRNIINVDPSVRVAFGRYAHALTSYLKRFGWYIWGATASEVGARVQRVCLGTNGRYAEDDYTNYDGSKPTILRLFDMYLYLTAFHTAYRTDLLDYFGALTYGTTSTRNGLRFYSGSMENSGQPNTSEENTNHHAFLLYVARRRRGLGIHESFDYHGDRGLFGGDDGIIDMADTTELVKFSNQLGMKIKIIACEQSCTFLGRVYPSPLETTGSIINVRRALQRLHMTSERDPTISDEEVAWRKLTSLYITDSQTPLIREIVHALLPTLGSKLRFSKTQERQPWISDVTLREEYTLGRVTAQAVLSQWEEPIYPPPPTQMALDCFLASLDWTMRDFMAARERVMCWKNIRDVDLLVGDAPGPVESKLECVVGDHFQAGPCVTPVDRDQEKALAKQAADSDVTLPHLSGTSSVDQLRSLAAVPVGETAVAPPQERKDVARAPKTKACKAYFEGKCTRSALKCKFSHKCCRDFVVGKCSRAKCKFEHLAG